MPQSSVFDKPMRWAQIAFVEDDPAHYDPDFWMDFLGRTHCEGVCLSAGGCVAFYPTDIPLHHRSKWLGDKDIFGEMAGRCRQRGMVVIARTDPHGARREVVDAHPDWMRRDADGRVVPHWAHRPSELAMLLAGIDLRSIRRSGRFSLPKEKRQ
jgi:hypothetical protein